LNAFIIFRSVFASILNLAETAKCDFRKGGVIFSVDVLISTATFSLFSNLGKDSVSKAER
jgi:hypothetical protein